MSKSQKLFELFESLTHFCVSNPKADLTGLTDFVREHEREKATELDS